MSSLIEFRFVKTKNRTPILIHLEDAHTRNELLVLASDILSIIEPLHNPLTIEDILNQAKKIVSDEPYSNSMVYLAVGALLQMKYLEIINF